MSRTTFLLVDDHGQTVATLKSLRAEWQPGETLIAQGRAYRVTTTVQLDPRDPGGATAILVVTTDEATTESAA